jgi:hypothetical protein
VGVGVKYPQKVKSLRLNELSIWVYAVFSLKRHDSVLTVPKAKSLWDNGKMPIAHGWDKTFFALKCLYSVLTQVFGHLVKLSTSYAHFMHSYQHFMQKPFQNARGF